ncbi:hypothetical protein I551_7918 [Mycobacterium ulcerans str. Harvey]|uniref:Uncharacterized protein n=1 Tax=Mycobacterium ulcerans str. Harvey TaxID=1299332 RepID=A0ABN0QMA7_MYCUL|nr:hypothetical protein I551_7918 [Mycobacterium ulcerans str. Harvey]
MPRARRLVPRPGRAAAGRHPTAAGALAPQRHQVTLDRGSRFSVEPTIGRGRGRV